MEFAEQLKSQIDIVAVIREYVNLKKAGTRYVGLCPFHQEKTPSFSVHPAHQFYKCFGCGAGGDLIKFVMEIEGLTFWEAVTQLAGRHGIPLPERPRYADDESRRRAAVHEMHELAQQNFRQSLDSAAGSAARDYLSQRGVSPQSAIEFGLGLAERSGQTLVRAFQQRGFTEAQMEASGLVLQRQEGSGWFDRFRGRLMFPIHNETGKIIAFAGRALAAGDEPKYMNSPETVIYRKSFVLYNLHRARREVRKNGRAILVEGYMDVIGLHQAGVFEAVASCGTALTAEQIRTLRRHSDRIVVNYDPDAAGAGAAERSIELLLEEGMHVRVLELPGGLDPDEFVRNHGAEAYRRLLEDAPGCFHWLADRVRRRFGMSSAEGRVQGFQQVLLPVIRKLPNKLERAAVVEEVAQYLRVDPVLVRQEFRRLEAARGPQAPPPPGSDVQPKEKVLVNVLLNNPAARREVIPRLIGLNSVQRFRTWPLLRVMLQLESSGAPWGYGDVEARLEEGDKILLAAVAFADAVDDEQQNSLKQALAFLPTLARQDREEQLAEIKSRIVEAERAGDLPRARQLMEELGRVAGEPARGVGPC